MKKTLTFEDGSVLVGSGSTFTITQENKGEVDIFDMPSQYIWVKEFETIDAYDVELPNNVYTGIIFNTKEKQYTCTLQVLEPCKTKGIKCKILGWTDISYVTAIATLTNGNKRYITTKFVLINGNQNYAKIDLVVPGIPLINISSCSNLAEVNLGKNINNILNISNNPKLTKITSDQKIKPSKLTMNNNPLLTQIPELIPGEYELKDAFKNDTSLDIDTSSFQLKGDCSNAFSNTGMITLVLNDAGCTNLTEVAKGCDKLQTVKFNGTFDHCPRWTSAFEDCFILENCDMSGVLNYYSKSDYIYFDKMFYNCHKLTTVKLDLTKYVPNNFIYTANYMFSGSKIIDDIVIDVSNSGGIKYFFNMCSEYTKRFSLKMNGGNANLYNLKENVSAFNNAISLEYISITAFSRYMENWDFLINTKLGTGSDENLQAFKDLINNAYNRKSANFSVCTIKLAETQKALLTADEITAFENKGYKIA